MTRPRFLFFATGRTAGPRANPTTFPSTSPAPRPVWRLAPALTLVLALAAGSVLPGCASREAPAPEARRTPAVGRIPGAPPAQSPPQGAPPMLGGRPQGPNLEALFGVMDQNHDGKIAIEEFRAFQERDFVNRDANHDGLLSKEEFSAPPVRPKGGPPGGPAPGQPGQGGQPGQPMGQGQSGQSSQPGQAMPQGGQGQAGQAPPADRPAP